MKQIYRLSLHIGLGAMLLAIILLVLDVPFMKTWFYCFAWWSFILIVDSLNFRLNKFSPLSESTKAFFYTAFVSVFAGRIADSGRDPVPVIRKAKSIIRGLDNIELLWASCRELLNLFQAEQAGCDIITIPPAIINKFKNINYDLTDFSHDTVKMFYEDAVSSGFSL